MTFLITCYMFGEILSTFYILGLVGKLLFDSNCSFFHCAIGIFIGNALSRGIQILDEVQALQLGQIYAYEQQSFIAMLLACVLFLFSDSGIKSETNS